MFEGDQNKLLGVRKQLCVAIRKPGLLPTILSIISIEEGVKLIRTDERNLCSHSPQLSRCLRVPQAQGPCRALTNICLLDAKAVLLGTGKHSKAVSAQQPQCCSESQGGVGVRDAFVSGAPCQHAGSALPDEAASQA